MTAVLKAKREKLPERVSLMEAVNLVTAIGLINDAALLLRRAVDLMAPKRKRSKRIG